MKNNSKLLSMLAIVFGLAIFFSCEEQNDLNSTQDLETVQYEMADNQWVTVILDPNLEHDSYTFASLEEHDDYLLTMEESGEAVTVNKKMFEDLKHYFDPYQIAILDQNYSIKVGGETFRVTKEAIYKRTEASSDWAMYLYYGLSGNWRFHLFITSPKCCYISPQSRTDPIRQSTVLGFKRS